MRIHPTRQARVDRGVDVRILDLAFLEADDLILLKGVLDGVADCELIRVPVSERL